MRLAALTFCLGLASPALADVGAALDRHVLPGLSAFAAAADGLDAAAQADCRAAALKPAFHDAFDAWAAIGDLRLGPSETGALSVAFWPDQRGATQRTLAQMIAARDAVAHDPDGYAVVSIAARGLFALEMLLFDPGFAAFDAGDYACALVRAVAADLGRQARALDAAWRKDFAAAIRTAGAPGNAVFLTGEEALRALYTQILASLSFTIDARLGRPLGTFERPQPTRAEAWRSARSLRGAVLSVEAALALARALADAALPRTDAAAARMRAAAARVGDPGFQDVADPQGRLRIEALQQAVRAVKAGVEAEVGAALGVTAGFNAQDGD